MVRHGRIPARLAVAFIPPAKRETKRTRPSSSRRSAASARAYAAVIRAAVEPNRACIVLGSGSLAAFVARSCVIAVPRRFAWRLPTKPRAADRIRAHRERLVGFALPLIDARRRPMRGLCTSRVRARGGLVRARGSALAATDVELIATRALTLVAAGGPHPTSCRALRLRRLGHAAAVAFVSPGRPRGGGGLAAALAEARLAPPDRLGGDERVAIYAPAS